MMVAMRGSVLVVVDDPAFRRLAHRVLASFGVTVAGEADTAAAAIAAAGTLKPDAGLVDVGRPDGDGLSLTRQLTDLPWRPRVVLTSPTRRPQPTTRAPLRRRGLRAQGRAPSRSLEPLLGAAIPVAAT